MALGFLKILDEDRECEGQTETHGTAEGAVR